MRAFLFALLAIAALLSDVSAQSLPQVICRFTDEAPVIDGRGSEEAWQRAEAVRLVDVSDLSGQTEPAHATQVRLLWDLDHLYVLYTAVDPDVWSTLTERDAALYDEEIVELFIDPDGDGRNYVEIEVNSIATVFDLLVPGAGGRGRPDWDPQLLSAVAVEGTANDPDDEDTSWSVEIALPWTALATSLLDVTGGRTLPPQIGDTWRFNFYRYERLRQDGAETGIIEYSAWSPTGAINFHVPDRFGLVIFGTAAGDIDPEGYPPGTLAPAVDLGLQTTEVRVPEPFRSQVPEGLTLNLPPGFSASVFAVGFSWPRFMAFDDADVLHLADAGADQIIALPDRNRDGIADERIIAADGFNLAHSLAFHDGYLYVGDTHQVLRLRDTDGDLVYEERAVLVDDIPSLGWHTTRTIAINPQTEKFYLGVGSPCDLCRSGSPVNGGTPDPLPPNPEWGSILEFDLDGSGRRVFASGVRNAVGLTVHPVTGEVWGNNNGHDLEGRTRPPEWIDVIRDGDFLGHPFVHSHQVWNDFTIDRYQRMLPITRADSLLAARQKRPVALVPAHYAPMGLHFYTHDQFPEIYRDAAFVAFRAGKAKLSSHPGYNVSALFSNPDGSEARIGEFITGFQTGTTRQSIWGYPVGLASDAEGSLFVGSDAGTRLVLKVTFSPVGGTWVHNLPDTIGTGASLSVAATVRVERVIEGGGPIRVTADLSELGGPSELPLSLADDNAYQLDFDLDVDAPVGLHAVRVHLSQEVDGQLQGFDFIKTIALLPQADQSLFGDGLAAGWQATVDAGAALDPDGAPPQRDGSALALEVVPVSAQEPWQLTLRPERAFVPIGYESLYFAFHPGDVDADAARSLQVQLNGAAVELLPPRDLDNWDWMAVRPSTVNLEGHVKLWRRQWQEVEIPLSNFGLDGPIRTLGFAGDLAGTFYLDDVRFKLGPELSPVAAVWSHELPEDVVVGDDPLRLAATVHLTRFEEDGPAPQVTADLSDLGGPASVALTPLGTQTFQLDTRLELEDVPVGERQLWIRVEQLTAQGRHWQRFRHALRLWLPDLPILGDELAAGWGLEAGAGAEVLGLGAEGPVFDGRAAAAVRVEPESAFRPWVVEIRPSDPVPSEGRVGLRFAFHPGDLSLPKLANLVLTVDGLSTDLVRGPDAFRVDLQRPEWQEIEIPFTAFDFTSRYRPGRVDSVDSIDAIRFEGNAVGTFYLDDVRLVSTIPAGPPPPRNTAVTEAMQVAQPDAFDLAQNYPNPFNSETVFRYALPRRSTVVLDVFNLAGQRVARLVYGVREPGLHTVGWDGRDDADRELATGIYVARLRADRKTSSRKVMLVR